MDVALNYCSPTVVALIITIVIILASWSDFLEFTVAQFARAATNSERGEREREREREKREESPEHPRSYKRAAAFIKAAFLLPRRTRIARVRVELFAGIIRPAGEYREDEPNGRVNEP